jgi:hypothetical protein
VNKFMTRAARTLALFSGLALGATTSLSIVGSDAAQAHEGHGHSGQGAEPVHGGVLKEGKTFDLELLTEGKSFKLFPLKEDGKAYKMDGLKFKAMAHPPKKPAVEIPLRVELDHAAGTFEAKGSHRYELRVEVKTAGKTETFKFQIEPKD